MKILDKNYFNIPKINLASIGGFKPASCPNISSIFAKGFSSLPNWRANPAKRSAPLSHPLSQKSWTSQLPKAAAACAGASLLVAAVWTMKSGFGSPISNAPLNGSQSNGHANLAPPPESALDELQKLQTAEPDASHNLDLSGAASAVLLGSDASSTNSSIASAINCLEQEQQLELPGELPSELHSLAELADLAIPSEELSPALKPPFVNGTDRPADSGNICSVSFLSETAKANIQGEDLKNYLEHLDEKKNYREAFEATLAGWDWAMKEATERTSSEECTVYPYWQDCECPARDRCGQLISSAQQLITIFLEKDLFVPEILDMTRKFATLTLRDGRVLISKNKHWLILEADIVKQLASKDFEDFKLSEKLNQTLFEILDLVHKGYRSDPWTLSSYEDFLTEFIHRGIGVEKTTQLLLQQLNVDWHHEHYRESVFRIFEKLSQKDDSMAAEYTTGIMEKLVNKDVWDERTTRYLFQIFEKMCQKDCPIAADRIAKILDKLAKNNLHSEIWDFVHKRYRSEPVNMHHFEDILVELIQKKARVNETMELLLEKLKVTDADLREPSRQSVFRILGKLCQNGCAIHADDATADVIRKILPEIQDQKIAGNLKWRLPYYGLLE